MADKNLDEYESLAFYKKHSKARKNGFAKFTEDGSYYFALFKDEDIVMLSQAYVNQAGRDNGIESVRKNSKLVKRYVFDERSGGKFGFALKAGNGQEIAISPDYAAQSKAEAVAGRLNGSAKKKVAPAKAKAGPQTKASAKSKTSAAKTDGQIENYHPLAFYQKHGSSVKDGFDSFSEGDAHYFTYKQDGAIALISESYTSKAGRDNGIASVKKNMPDEKRYQAHVHKNGKHYFDLNAANGQEIATSIWYGSAAAARAGAAALRGEKAPKKANDEDDYRPLAFYNKHTKGRKSGIESFKGDDGLYYFAYFENGKIRLLSEGYPTTTARDTGVASVEKNIKLEKRYEYRGPFKNGKYDYRLKAGNGKEIARSVWYGSAAAAATGAAYLMGTRKRAAPKAAPAKAAPVKTASTPKPISKPKVTPKAAGVAAVAATAATASAIPAMAKAAKPVAPYDKDDDYLKCEAYHGHKVTDERNNVAFFSHSDNKEYFVVYDDNGDVLIRSEGFNSISKRSSELAAVLRLKNNPDTFTRIEKDGYFMDILKDESGREVGRSCLRKIVPLAAIAPAAVAAPLAAGAPAAAVVAAQSATATGGGFAWGWLKWLLPLLLLLLLAFFGLKACNGNKADIAAKAAAAQKVAAEKAEVAKVAAAKEAAAAKKLAAEKAEAAKKMADEKAAAAAAALAATAEKVAAETVAKEVPTPEPVAVTDNMSRLCGPSGTAIFNVPTFSTPVSVGRLGTYPQFGDSHGLTPTEFYNKLDARHAASEYDRQYLDYLARSLGYKGGFGDMSAADFSNDQVAQGAKGLLGYGEFHGTAYSQLNVSSSRDLEAFRLRAANGTDVHFMKSCGNYMYVCQ
ncbi:DUF1508 domain-containing protein [Hellea balneolensis]|uniref:DUF1508 domain-containing protein n=1 Tax=Hellea balneolensis TaxID=287478 RepID=UPI0004285B8F|nr:YegP family protein [Hellea balneolensis]